MGELLLGTTLVASFLGGLVAFARPLLYLGDAPGLPHDRVPACYVTLMVPGDLPARRGRDLFNLASNPRQHLPMCAPTITSFVVHHFKRPPTVNVSRIERDRPAKRLQLLSRTDKRRKFQNFYLRPLLARLNN